MSFTVSYTPQTLLYRRPARTSRGQYVEHRALLVTLRDEAHPERRGVGECAPLPDLSLDRDLARLPSIDHLDGPPEPAKFEHFPALLMALETAWRDLQHNASGILFDNDFSRGRIALPINGLVWMSDCPTMLREAERKVRDGFRCVKLKIGGQPFEEEVALVAAVRALAPPERLTIRLDANGAFEPADALRRLDSLEPFQIHSIEQPIRSGQAEQLAQICKRSPIPIALDEELIPATNDDDRQRLLDKILPQYVVLKPTLHGGLSGARRWCQLAKERGIASWVTSALESNIGLNAVCQLAADLYAADGREPMPQGLGTGQLFTSNNPSRLELVGDKMHFRNHLVQ